MNYDSYYKNDYANRTVDWLPMDTKQLYQKNLLTRYNELKKHNWIDQTFTYAFNSHGFRCAEFSDDPCIMFLGCSYTVGVGLPLDTIWPELVAKALGLKCANLGIGGSSSDTAFRLCLGYIDQLTPKAVVFLEPPPYRCELVNDTTIDQIYANHDGFNWFTKHWFVDENNHFFNYKKNQLAIKSMCEERKIKYLLPSYLDLIKEDKSLARDLAHQGVSAHSIFADEIVEQLS